MELARTFAQEVWEDLQRSIDFVGGLRNKIDALHAELAERRFSSSEDMERALLLISSVRPGTKRNNFV